jgi:hypothetical protein
MVDEASQLVEEEPVLWHDLHMASRLSRAVDICFRSKLAPEEKVKHVVRTARRVRHMTIRAAEYCLE